MLNSLPKDQENKMLCSICGKNPATIHIQEIIGSEKKVLHLCAQCAEKRAKENGNFQDFNLAEVLLQLSSQIGNQIQQEDKGKMPPPMKKIVCKSCGWDSESFQKTGKMGCPDCYRAFRKVLEQTIDTMHRGTSHTGKHPLPAGSPAKKRKKPSISLLQMNLKHTQAELQDAIAAERYEEAAELRDKINQMQKELEALQNEK